MLLLENVGQNRQADQVFTCHGFFQCGSAPGTFLSAERAVARPGGPIAQGRTGQDGLGRRAARAAFFPLFPLFPLSLRQCRTLHLCARSVSVALVATRSKNQPYSLPSYEQKTSEVFRPLRSIQTV